MHRVPPFSPQELTSICKILADTHEGLTGGEITYLLKNCRLPDVSPEMPKWKRLFNAFVGIQNEKQIGNYVVMFINRAMNPVQYTDSPSTFESRREELNKVLSFSGLSIRKDGKIVWVNKAQNLDEAMTRANRLEAALKSRQVHEDVLKFCRAELLRENYFHAVFEAMKSIAQKIQRLASLDSDGAKLVDQAFGFGDEAKPLLAINSLSSETDRGEQRGFVNLLKGLFGTIRNPLAHNPKIEWNMSEQDALDIFSILSLVHRKLDKVQRHPGP